MGILGRAHEPHTHGILEMGRHLTECRYGMYVLRVDLAGFGHTFVYGLHGGFLSWRLKDISIMI